MISTEEKQGWLVTFADLLSLLLTFFILLFSLSSIKDESKQNVQDNKTDRIKSYKSFDNQAIDYMYANIINKFDNQKDIVIKKIDNKIAISFYENKIFQNNSLNLNDQAQDNISMIYEILYGIKSRIDIVGHVNSVIMANDSTITWSDILLKTYSVAKAFERIGYDKQRVRCYAVDDSYFLTILAKDKSLYENYLNSNNLKIEIFILPD